MSVKMCQLVKMFDNACDIILLLTPEGHILWGNKAAVSAYGYSQEEFKNLDIIDLCAFQTAKIVDARLKNAMKGGLFVEGLHRQKNGETFPVEFTMQCVSSEPPLLLYIVRDTTFRKKTENELEKTKEQFESLFNNTTDAIIIFNLDGYVIHVNKGFENIYGWTFSEVLNLKLPMVPDDLVGDVERYFKEIIAGKQISTYETIRKRKDGTLFEASITPSPIRDSNGSVISIAHIVRDITERKQFLKALEESEARYRYLIENIPDGILVHSKGNIDFANQPITKLLNYNTPSNLTGMPVLDIIAPCSREIAAARINRIYNGETNLPIIEQKLLKRDSRPVSVEITSASINYLDQSAVLTIVRDLTERKNAEALINYRTYYDNSTGLPNSLYLKQLLSKNLNFTNKTNNHLSLLSIELDRFEIVNDTFGKETGDQLIKHVIARIKNVLKKDEPLFRICQNEFIIVLPQIHNVSYTVRLSEQINKEISKPFKVDGSELNISVNTGIAMYPEDGHNAETIIKNARLAMHQARETGKNQYQLYNKKFNDSLVEKITLENLLYKAIKNNEFVLYYQPLVELASGNITGVEALIRWDSPELGFVSPSRFIAIAEETETINQIGEWVLRQACNQGVLWQRSLERPIRVSVNLSAKQLQNNKLFHIVKTVLSDTGLNPSLLDIEITESFIIKDLKASLRVLNKLRCLGVSVSLDDFGTGYSSLNHLKKLPITTLKIDRSFIKNIADDNNDFTITKALVSLAQSLNLRVVAEGVETSIQADLLKKIGCHNAQGYYYSKPVTAHTVQKLFGHAAN